MRTVHVRCVPCPCFCRSALVPLRGQGCSCVRCLLHPRGLRAQRASVAQNLKQEGRIMMILLSLQAACLPAFPLIVPCILHHAQFVDHGSLRSTLMAPSTRPC
jgi:hypothetical protein